MLEIDVQGDDLLKQALNNMLSGLLPHENYDYRYFVEILLKINQLIKPDELYGEYSVFLKLLNEFRRVGSVFSNYEYNVTESAVESVLYANIQDLVRNKDTRISEVLNTAGLDTNTDIQSVFEDACQFLYERVMDLYKECFNLKVNSSEALSYFPTLKATFVTNVAQSSLLAQADMLRDSAFINNKIYQGPQDWLRYTTEVKNIITKRIEDDADGIIRVDTADARFNLLQENYGTFETLAPYGIPPIDDSTPMMRYRLALLVANENVGKTSIAIEWAVNLLMNGKKVLFMCGETRPSKIQSIMLVNYIYKKHQIYVDRQAISREGELPDDIQKIVNIACAEFGKMNLLRLNTSFSYDTFYDELVAEYDKEPFDAVFIDHSCALISNSGKLYEDLGSLALQARNFKREYPVYMCILSHMSSSAKDLLSRGKEITTSTAKGNSTLDAEADEVFLLTSNEALQSRDEILFINTKRRDASKVGTPIVLKTKFEVSSFYYDESSQDNDVDVAGFEEFYDIDDDDEDYGLMDDN